MREGGEKKQSGPTTGSGEYLLSNVPAYDLERERVQY